MRPSLSSLSPAEALRPKNSAALCTKHGDRLEVRDSLSLANWATEWQTTPPRSPGSALLPTFLGEGQGSPKIDKKKTVGTNLF